MQAPGPKQQKHENQHPEREPTASAFQLHGSLHHHFRTRHPTALVTEPYRIPGESGEVPHACDGPPQNRSGSTASARSRSKNSPKSANPGPPENLLDSPDTRTKMSPTAITCTSASRNAWAQNVNRCSRSSAQESCFTFGR